MFVWAAPFSDGSFVMFFEKKKLYLFCWCMHTIQYSEPCTMLIENTTASYVEDSEY